MTRRLLHWAAPRIVLLLAVALAVEWWMSLGAGPRPTATIAQEPLGSLTAPRTAPARVISPLAASDAFYGPVSGLSAPSSAQPVAAPVQPLRQVASVTAGLSGAPNGLPTAAGALRDQPVAPEDGSRTVIGAPLPAFSGAASKEEAAAPLITPGQETRPARIGGAGPVSRHTPAPSVVSQSPAGRADDPSPPLRLCADPCHVSIGTPRPVTWQRSVASSFGINDGYLWGHLACGGRLTPTAMVVAHRSLPCGTRVVLRFRGRTVVATVADRGPFCCGMPYSRTWDLSPGVARALKFDGLDWVEWRLVP